MHLFCWAGSKERLLNTLFARLPPNFTELDTWVDAFAGAGSTIFHVLSHYDNIKRAIVCDKNEALINVYTLLQSNPYDVSERLELLRVLRADSKDPKALYYDLRDRFNYGRCDKYEQAALFIYLMCTCFNGLARCNSSGYFNSPYGGALYLPNQDRLLELSDLLQRCEIMCADFEQTMKYSGSWAMYYFDPPYVPLSATACFTSYSAGGFAASDQSRLIGMLQRLDAKGVPFMVSNSEKAEALYAGQGWHIEGVPIRHTIKASGDYATIRELIIRNYEQG